MCCIACVPALHVCCKLQYVLSTGHQHGFAEHCSQPCNLYAGILGVTAYVPAPIGDAREDAAADLLSMAGRTCAAMACVLCGRARMSTGADCRTSSAPFDRQGWASGERGRGRSTVWRGGTWGSRQARAWEMGRAMRREDMLGKCCLGVRNVSWLLAGLGKEVASAEHAGPEGS